ncbi:hypothetical protein EDD17DRAFT_1779867 [Pisolithus thermaeus]|nr:hypothetical protein EDD17DRAFT_1779867 [Pisolithus thermaeus]
MDEFLRLNIIHDWIHTGIGVSFANTQSFLKSVDRLCTGPAWTCEMIDICGDIISKDGTMKHEQLELWQCDPIKCVQDLIGNPTFWDVMSYIPECAYMDANGENCIYDEMWTGDWWWDVQTKLPKGDKTSLSQFSGDKKVWLVYLTIGNISKDVRHQVSVHVTMLIGYLPISKLECFQKKNQSLMGYCLFHHSMSLLLHPLVDAGHHGREMTCANGYLHHVHPILATYICLVACNKESRCPCCLTLYRMQKNKRSRKFNAEGLCAVFDPFWKDLPFTDIFACLTPDILHQLHKGVVHNHLIQWCMLIISKKEIDAHFQAMTQYPSLCHFKKGISLVSQWTSTEHKEMERVFIRLLAVNDHVLIVAHSLLDFIYYLQLQCHMDTTLAAMKESLKMFHDHKHVLIKLEVHEEFNDSYHMSNKHDYMEQMALWLQCQEAMHYKSMYLAWRKPHAIGFESGFKDGNGDSDTHIGDCARSAECISPLTLFTTVNTCYKVAKTPPHHQVSIDSIESDYKAIEFLPTLEHFLVSQLGQKQSFQKIHTSPKTATCGQKAKTTARFDTIFIMDEGPCLLKCVYILLHHHDTALTSLCQGMQVAQIQIIFKLPKQFGTYLHPLAYVEWFTTLQHWDCVSGLYIVTCSTQNHHHNASIISINHVDHACHLQGQCGREISKDWSADSVLEKAVSFLLILTLIWIHFCH